MMKYIGEILVIIGLVSILTTIVALVFINFGLVIGIITSGVILFGLGMSLIMYE